MTFNNLSRKARHVLTLCGKLHGHFIFRNPLLSTVFLSRSMNGTNHTVEYDGLSPFGKVIVQCSKAINPNFTLISLDPQTYPDQNKARICTSSSNMLSKLSKETNTLSIYDKCDSVGASCIECEAHIEIPIKFDADLTIEGKSYISLRNLENNCINMKLNDGYCHFSNIQTGNFKVEAECCNIDSSKLLQATNIDIFTEGNVSIHKPICQELCITTINGCVDITNLYAKKSRILTVESDVHIANSHMDTEITVVRGTILVDSVSGNLKVDMLHKGDIHVAPTQHDTISINVMQGDITLTIPKMLSSYLDVKGQEVKIDDGMCLKDAPHVSNNGQMELKTLHEGTEAVRGAVGRIKAQTENGVIHLVSSTTSWFSDIQAKYDAKM